MIESFDIQVREEDEARSICVEVPRWMADDKLIARFLKVWKGDKYERIESWETTEGPPGVPEDEHIVTAYWRRK